MKKESPYHYSEFTDPISCDFTTSNVAGNVDFHMHNSHEIYLLVDGHIQYFVENACYDMNPGSLILFSNREIHKAINTSNEPFTRLVIHVNPSYIRPYCTPLTNLLDCFHRDPGKNNLVLLSQADHELLISMAKNLEKAIKNRRPYGSDLTALTTIIQILILINQAWQNTGSVKTAPRPHRAQTIMNYIDDHLTEHLTLDSISLALSLDKYYLSHLFKSETESSIFQYIVVKRVALAKELLLKGHTVSEACHLSGFIDYSNFIRTFRQTTGCTPGQFKRLNP
ncbi:AraC family transcriptional regulator [Lacrimispora amygdalina]|uniref:AraC family transcriptional regulator n=1 Tax=Lacrimispora amygdalina TaxID=253257 RepID=A0A3E2N6L2_9FIRM|nr:AraC family transcriptional regulator [Clostridium indicum]RFZ76616.1 AraC family transcriptional regulator [Clostridium indicum]